MKSTKIYIAAHYGMVGRSLACSLEQVRYHNIIEKTSEKLVLRHQKEVQNISDIEKPETVIGAAAKVIGILSNEKFPYQFLMENLQIQLNFIDCAYQHDVKKIPFDNCELETSHVITAIIKKFEDAKNSATVAIISRDNRAAFRTFLYVDDLANEIIRKKVGHTGVIFYDSKSGRTRERCLMFQN